MTRNLILSSSIAIATFLASQNSFALAKMAAQCETKDGRYEIAVFDKQGTGLERESDLGAEIRDTKTDKVVASYEIVGRQGKAFGFNPFHYIDTESNGESFDLSGHSTNIPGYHFEGKLENGKRIRAQAVDCSIFGGVNL